jgi:ketosteroid isomerase-like protein
MEIMQNEIDKTVWSEFKAAFENIDANALNAIYADEVLRVTPNGIDTKSHFKAKNIERFQMLNEKSASIKLDFWFESRHTNSDTSYEVGFYKITTKMGDNTSINYGQFHIVLKKISGHWKIVQDWDTTIMNGQTIGQKEFEQNRQNELY